MGGYRYTAFGQTLPADASTPAPGSFAADQPLRWKPRPFVNTAGGIYDMRARWWSPQLGAFLSVDELAYHDRNSTLWGWPGQNPIKWKDPSGHCPACVGAAVGAVGGAVIGYYSYYASTPAANFSWGGAALATASRAGLGAIAGGTGAALGVLAGGGGLATALGLSDTAALAGLGGAAAGGQAFPSLTDKILNQLEARGWTLDAIERAIETGEQIPAINKATDNAAIRYVDPATGQSVVVDIVTNTVIHVGVLAVIDIQDDYYWDVPADRRYDPYRKPDDLVLGQLCDNWTELQRLQNDEKPLLNYDLVWLAAILRRIGEVAGEAGPQEWQ